FSSPMRPISRLQLTTKRTVWAATSPQKRTIGFTSRAIPFSIQSKEHDLRGAQMSFLVMRKLWRMIMKRYTPALLAALAAIVVVPFVEAEPQTIVVRMMESKSFEPKTITVKPGDTVVWKNVSDMAHSVTDMSSLAITAQDAALPPNGKE